MTGSKSQQYSIMAGLMLGAVAGIGAKAWASDSDNAQQFVDFFSTYIAYPIGQVFLRILFFVVVPLVFASLASGVARLGDLSQLGRIGGRTLAFFTLTSICAACIGLAGMNLIEPGVGFDAQTRDQLMADFATDAASVKETSDAQRLSTPIARVNQILDMFVPRNILGSIIKMEMIPLIVFSLLFGAALTLLPHNRRDAMTLWLDTLADVMVTIVGFVMMLAPYAVFCLVFIVTSRFGWELLAKLAAYVGIVLVGYLIQVGGLYPVLLRWLADRRPMEFFRKAMPIMVTAFSTSSSSATLPTSMRLARSELGVRESVCGFVLPLCATMSMNGTALFEGAAVLFIAQVFGVDLSLGDQALVIGLCVLTSIGAA
ncbi:MAG: dicarboxylate/amino acid:cation symporter, partial [Nitrospiraceae bacterium]